MSQKTQQKVAFPPKNPAITEPESIVKDVKKRKMIKARRLLKTATFENVQKKSTTTSDTDILLKNKHKNLKRQNNFCETGTKSISISPSSSAENLSPNHFDISNEKLQPSTSGSSKRRTHELETSVNDVSLLKAVSEFDSFRMIPLSSSIRDEGSPAISPNYSKITQRRKWEKSDRFSSDLRLSKASPPWAKVNYVANTPFKNSPSYSDKKSRSLLKSVFNNIQSEESKPSALGETITIKMAIAAVHHSPWRKGEYTDKENTPLKNTSLHSVKKSQSQSKNCFNNIERQEPKSTTMEKKVSKIKMPNFAAIHQKAFDKMENLSEFKQRKEERAKMLLSGQKPFSFNKTPVKKSRKILRFASSTSEKEKSPTFIPLPNTPKPKCVILDDSVDSLETSEIVQTLPSSKTSETQTSANKGFNHRFGFNFNFCKQPVRKEEIKAMVARKSKPIKNTIEARKVVIKGVRSNRRFDLLMDMRKGK